MSKEEMMDEEDDIFNWQDFLESSKSVDVPQILFSHVEESVLNGLQPGMCLEVSHGSKGEHFWPASIHLACGPLLQLRFLGLEEDRTYEFWCDLSKVQAYPLGYSQNPFPPAAVLEKLGDHWAQWIAQKKEQVRSVPAEFLSGVDCTPIDRIKIGMKMLIHDILNPYNLWIVSVVRNVGGRLLVRYVAPQQNSANNNDEWLFYTSSRLFPIDWVQTQGAPWKLEPPQALQTLFPNESDWKEVFETAEEEAKKIPMPQDLLTPYQSPEIHNFTEGMILEAIPNNKKNLCSAKVDQIINEKYFIVKIDFTQELLLCTKDNPFIFPIGFANKYDLDLTPPADWTDTESKFNWNDYLAVHNNIQVAPEILFLTHENLEGFEQGMMLEAPDPLNPNVICASSIAKVFDHLLVINLNCQSASPIIASPTDLFPVGWCESNSYPLRPPSQVLNRQLPLPTFNLPDLVKPASCSAAPRSSWCPKIYFNHKCFSGPLISKGKLAGLPKSVGPGPIHLVLREVLGMLISVAYKSSKVLNELKTMEKAPPGYQLEMLKAKCKNNTFQGNVAIVRSADQIADFCHDICRRLRLCPYLFGPTSVGVEGCPERCSFLSKTKFTHYISRDQRKAGRPTNAGTPMPVVSKPKGKRGRKRLHLPRPPGAAAVEPMETEEPSEATPSTSTSATILTPKASDSDNKSPSASEPESSTESKSTTGESNDIDIKSSPEESPIKMIETPQKEEISEKLVDQAMQKEYARSPTAQSFNKDCNEKENFILESNPLHWSEDDVYDYLVKNTINPAMAERCRNEMIDGQAFMLLTLPTIRENLQLRLGAAKDLCQLVERVKCAYYLQYLEPESLSVFEP